MVKKNGLQDERGTTKPELTSKGLATLIIEGELEKDDLVKAVMEIELAKNYERFVSDSFVSESHVDECLRNIFEKIKHKINLKYFDEKYFNQMLTISFLESLLETMKTIV